MSALLTLLSNHGILPDSVAKLSSIELVSSFAWVRESIVSRLESPDPPPPRA